MALTPEKLDWKTDEWIPLRDAAALIGIDRSVAQRWIYQNKLPAKRDKTGWWVRESDAIASKHLKAPSGRLGIKREWYCPTCGEKFHAPPDEPSCPLCGFVDITPVINENRIRGGRYMPYKGRDRWDTLANQALRSLTDAAKSG